MKKVDLNPFVPLTQSLAAGEEVTSEQLEKIKLHVEIELTKGILTINYIIKDPNRKILNLYPVVSNLSAFDRSYRKDELWKKTCFEFFVKKQNDENYYEFNANAQGNWNYYKFHSYRSPIQVEDKITQIELKALSELPIKLRFKMNLNPLFKKGDRLLFSFCSVVLIADQITYWSNRHSVEKPDFHDANNFTINLEFQ